MKTEMLIPVIAGQVHLGCLPEERVKTQAVETEIHIRFKSLPPACKKDTLKNTACYAEMAACLEQVFKKKHYATIEHLGMESFKKLHSYLKKIKSAKGSELTLTINKVKPPIATIKKGSHFKVSAKV